MSIRVVEAEVYTDKVKAKLELSDVAYAKLLCCMQADGVQSHLDYIEDIVWCELNRRSNVVNQLERRFSK